MTAPRAPRLSIVIPDLACGGIQRSVLTLSEGLAQRGYRVTLLTFSDGRSDFFPVPAGVARAPLGLRSARQTPFLKLIPRTIHKLGAIRAAVLESEADLVISHAPQVNVPTLFALARSGLPIIVTEHGDVATTRWKKAAWYRLRRLCYGFAFRVVSVSEAVDRNVSWLPQERRAIISNPFVVPASNPLPDPALRALPAQLAGRGDFIVSMGRLSHAKGFDLLIAAYARIAADFPHWRLMILGEGELRSQLEQQVRDLGLGERVVFAGAVVDPSVFLRRAKLFVMASRQEGFPMAHGEALACGLPVIATDCPSRPLLKGERLAAGGVRELIRRSVDGVLVPPEDPVVLAHAMADLMSDENRRKEFARHAPQVVERFSVERILEDWERLIQQAIGSSIRAQMIRAA